MGLTCYRCSLSVESAAGKWSTATTAVTKARWVGGGPETRTSFA